MPIKPRRINRESRGFLDLFRAKVGGQGPDEFSNTAQPSVDLVAFLAAGNTRVGVFGGNATGAPQTYSVTVPDDEVWLLHGFTGYATWTTRVDQLGETFQARIGIDGIPTTAGSGSSFFACAYLSNFRGASVANTVWASFSETWTPGSRFIAPAGASFEFQLLNKTGAGTLTMQSHVLYTPLQV